MGAAALLCVPVLDSCAADGAPPLGRAQAVLVLSCRSRGQITSTHVASLRALAAELEGELLPAAAPLLQSVDDAFTGAGGEAHASSPEDSSGAESDGAGGESVSLALAAKVGDREWKPAETEAAMQLMNQRRAASMPQELPGGGGAAAAALSFWAVPAAHRLLDASAYLCIAAALLLLHGWLPVVLPALALAMMEGSCTPSR